MWSSRGCYPSFRALEQQDQASLASSVFKVERSYSFLSTLHSSPSLAFPFDPFLNSRNKCVRNVCHHPNPTDECKCILPSSLKRALPDFLPTMVTIREAQGERIDEKAMNRLGCKLRRVYYEPFKLRDAALGCWMFKFAHGPLGVVHLASTGNHFHTQT